MCGKEIHPRFGRGRDIDLLFGVAGAGLGRLGILAVFDPAFVAQITAFLRLALAFGRLAVLVHLFLDEPCTFLDFTLDAHGGLLFEVSPRLSVSGKPMRQEPICSCSIWNLRSLSAFFSAR